jgi:hypothetical protein
MMFVLITEQLRQFLIGALSIRNGDWCVVSGDWWDLCGMTAAPSFCVRTNLLSARDGVSHFGICASPRLAQILKTAKGSMAEKFFKLWKLRTAGIENFGRTLFASRVLRLDGDLE